MHVIYIHQYFNTPDMQGGTRSYEFARRLVEAGNTVDMVTSWRNSAPNKGWFRSEVDGIRVHWLPVEYSNRMSYVRRLGAFLKFAYAVAKYASFLDGDVVFASSTPLTISIPAVYVAWRRRVKMVFEVRDLWPEMPIAIGALKSRPGIWLARRLAGFAYSNSAHVIALSPGMASGVAATGVSRDRVSVIPNCADVDAFDVDDMFGIRFRQSIGVGDDKIVIGYVGTLGRINGVEYLVRLASELKDDPRFRFVIMGDGHEAEKVRSLASTLGVLDTNVTIMAPRPKREIPSVLSSFDIATSLFLPIPEMEHNSANKFFDALAAGRCVAINYGGWQAEILARAHAGFRMPQDTAAAAAEIAAVASNPGQLKEMGRNARRLAESEFSRDRLYERFESVLREYSGVPEQTRSGGYERAG